MPKKPLSRTRGFLFRKAWSSRSPARGALHALSSWAVREQNTRPWTDQHLRHGSRPRPRTQRRERLRALPRSTGSRHRVGLAPHPERGPRSGRGNEAHGGHGHGHGHSSAGGRRRPQAALRERLPGSVWAQAAAATSTPPAQGPAARPEVTLDPSTKFGRRTRAPKRTGLGAELAPGTSLRRAPRRPARVWGRKAARRPR